MDNITPRNLETPLDLCGLNSDREAGMCTPHFKNSIWWKETISYVHHPGYQQLENEIYWAGSSLTAENFLPEQ